jgi:hypothetical protein
VTRTHPLQGPVPSLESWCTQQGELCGWAHGLLVLEPVVFNPCEILGVYFLFSVPGDSWRLAIADRAIQRIRIVLGASGIVSAEPR